METPKPRNFSTFYLILLAGAAVIWVFLFRKFVFAQTTLIYDAAVYAEHVKYYIDNITRGIYPFWDPSCDFGWTNTFYLRRIGEFNPAYWLVALPYKLGINFYLAYSIFLAAYFFAGIAAFYALARRLSGDMRAATIAALLLMFSSLSTELFSSYLILMIVPGICFFYCVTAFIQTPSRVFLLGATCAAMTLLITYIPFFFLAIVMIAGACFLITYANVLPATLSGAMAFFGKNKMFAGICAVLVGVSLVPGLLCWNMFKQKESVIYHRQEADNTIVVPIKVVNEGGVIAPLLVDNMTEGLNEKRPGDFYVSLFAVLIVLSGAFTMVRRRQVVLFMSGLVVYLISSADASALHGFLYQHVFFFKYFRNLHFFLPLYVLPALILFAAGVFHELLKGGENGKRPLGAVAVITAVHAAAVAFFVLREDVTTGGTYAAIAASWAALMLAALGRLAAGWAAVILTAAVLIQPMEVFSHLEKFYTLKYYVGDGDSRAAVAKLGLPKHQTTEELLKDPNAPLAVGIPYFSSVWFHDTFKHINHGVRAHYLAAKFLLYDRLQVMDDPPDFRLVENVMAGFQNRAIIPAAMAAGVPLSNGVSAEPMAQLIGRGSPVLTVEEFNANALKIKTRLPAAKFLVYNANYHPGWRVYCDGKEIPLLRANYAFQGIWVPAGEHVITWHFGSAVQHWVVWTILFVFTGSWIWLIGMACRKRVS